MARDRVTPFVKMIEDACVRTSVQTVFEAMRLFGYINEQQYSELNTTWQQMTSVPSVRNDGAETIELSRMKKTSDPETLMRQEETRHPMRSEHKVRELSAEDLGVAPLSKAIKRPQDDDALAEQLRENVLPSEY